jgi:hypothetical protein
MKKALAMALGAMLVAGSAMPAAAKSQIDFSGHYRLFQMNHWNQNFGDKDNQLNDTYFINRLQMDFAFHATDEISVYWRLRAPAAQRWGTNQDTTNIKSQFYYGQVKQDWGTVAIGRLNDARTMFGLASLGWVPGGPDVNATGFEPFDIDDPRDGIHYINKWDNGFQLAAGWLRLNAERTRGTGTIANPNGRDEATDLFAVEPAFLWDGGGASLGLHYLRVHTSKTAPSTGASTTAANSPAMKMFRINPAISHSFGDFSVHFEGLAGWGSQEQQNGNSRDSEGYAFYMDVDYNYGPGNVNLAGWWAAGPDTNGGGDKDKGMVDMGEAFAPLVVAYNGNTSTWGRDDWANGRGNDTTAIGVANFISGPIVGGASQGNHWAIDLNGAHAFTDDLTLTYALAYLALNKTRDGAEGKGIGFEADLGLSIQLLDNLNFGTTFGYLFAGDALKENRPGYAGYGKDAEDAYTWLNTLTFAF